MKKLLALLLATMLVFTVAGCDKAAEVANKALDKLTDGTSANDVVGFYKMVSMTMNGQAVPAEATGAMNLTINADGTANLYNGVADTPLTWTQSGNQVSLVGENGIPDVFTIQGNSLVYENAEAGLSMVFSK